MRHATHHALDDRAMYDRAVQIHNIVDMGFSARCRRRTAIRLNVPGLMLAARAARPHRESKMMLRRVRVRPC
jgi:hypothetical protein